MSKSGERSEFDAVAQAIRAADGYAELAEQAINDMKAGIDLPIRIK